MNVSAQSTMTETSTEASTSFDLVSLVGVLTDDAVEALDR